jgi:hypothetical protein
MGAFVHKSTGEVKGENGKTEKVVFKGLTWKASICPGTRLRLKLMIPQDVHIYLFPLPDGTAEIIIKLTQRWVKNNKDPENHVYVSTLQSVTVFV